MARRRGKRGSGGITERRLADGRIKYQAQWSTTEGGRRVRKSETFDLKRDAEWWLGEAKRGDAPDVDLTVKEYLERWLTGKRKIRASTKALYRSHVERHIVPGLGHLSLAELRSRHVERFVDALKAKGLQSSTANGILRTLRMALGAGVKRRELADNPAALVESPSFSPPPIVPMTSEEAAALVDAVRGHWLEHVVRFLLGSSVRVGEALGLNQGDVIPTGFVRVMESKTLIRAVPVSADGMAALDEAIRRAPRRGPNEPVFFGVQTGDRLTRAVVTHALPTLLVKAGLYRRTPHGLRHGAATLMLTAGIPMPVIAKQLGHKSERMTARYAHVIPDSQRRAVDTLDEAIRTRK